MNRKEDSLYLTPTAIIDSDHKISEIMQSRLSAEARIL